LLGLRLPAPGFRSRGTLTQLGEPRGLTSFPQKK
jgi:hypothetical protein